MATYGVQGAVTVVAMAVPVVVSLGVLIRLMQASGGATAELHAAYQIVILCLSRRICCMTANPQPAPSQSSWQAPCFLFCLA